MMLFVNDMDIQIGCAMQGLDMVQLYMYIPVGYMVCSKEQGTDFGKRYGGTNLTITN